jgi:hypothetical protein
MVIGGYDQSLVDGGINWIKCSATAHPQIPLDGIIVNGVTIKRVDNRPMQAIIDVIPTTMMLNLVRYRRINTRSIKHRECHLRANTGSGTSK